MILFPDLPTRGGRGAEAGTATMLDAGRPAPNLRKRVLAAIAVQIGPFSPCFVVFVFVFVCFVFFFFSPEPAIVINPAEFIGRFRSV